MKKIFNIFLIAIAALFIISCDNLIEKNIENPKSDLPIVYFSISEANDTSRFAIPKMELNDLDEISLKCYYPALDEAEDLKIWKTDESSSAYKKFQNARFCYLPYEGDWQFVFTAKKNFLQYKSMVNQKITDGSNKIEFILTLIDDKEGRGNFSVKVSSLSDKTNSVKAVLYKMKENFQPGDKVLEKTLIPEASSIVFKEKVDTGYYIAEFEYFNINSDFSIKLGCQREYIVIRANELSESMLNSNARGMKSIFYNSTDLTVLEGSSHFEDISKFSFIKNQDKYPKAYSYYTNFDLPEPKVPGYTFDGWYTNEKYDEGVKITNTKELLKTGYSNLYAKWTQSLKINIASETVKFKPMKAKELTVEFEIPEDEEVQIKKFDFIHTNKDEVLDLKYNAEQRIITLNNYYKIENGNGYKDLKFIPIGKPRKIDVYAENEEGIKYRGNFTVENEITSEDISATLQKSEKISNETECFTGLDTLASSDYYIMKVNFDKQGVYVVQNFQQGIKDWTLFAFDSTLNRIDEDNTDGWLSFNIKETGDYYLVANYRDVNTIDSRPKINLYESNAVKSLNVSKTASVSVGKQSEIEFEFDVDGETPEIDFHLIEPDGRWWTDGENLKGPKDDFIYVSAPEFDVSTRKGKFNIFGVTPGTVEITLRDKVSGLSQKCSVTCDIDSKYTSGTLQVREGPYEEHKDYGRDSGKFDNKKAFIWKLDQSKDYQKLEKGKTYTFDNENKLNDFSSKPYGACIFILYGYSNATGKYTLLKANYSSFEFTPEEDYDVYYYIARVGRNHYTNKFEYTGDFETYLYRHN